MDAVEFLKARRRMCETNDCNKGGCPLFEHNCDNGTDEEKVQTVAIVEQWAKEHPVKTRQSEFLKMFPHPRFDRNGCLMICPMDAVGKEYMRDDIQGCINADRNICCEDCCRDFWLKEIE